MAVNILFVLTLAQMAPHLRVVAQVLTKDIMLSNQYIEATPFEANIADKKLIDEMLVRHYLEMRHTLFSDAFEMGRRWGPGGPVWILSTPAVFGAFYAGKAEMLEEIGKSPISRTVDVRSVNRKDDIFSVEFDVLSYDGVSAVSQKSYHVILHVAYTPARRVFSPNFTNPYGMIIVSYGETEKR